jgi:cell division protein FtsW (lipid II flippase)
MKKPIKTALLVLAAFTVIAVITAVIMLKAVSGDSLFYMDSTLGNICAAGYRWLCLASGILTVFWILLAVKNRKAIAAKLPKFKRGEKKAETR